MQLAQRNPAWKVQDFFSLVLTLANNMLLKINIPRVIFTSYTILFLAKTIEFCGKYRVCEKCIRRMASITGRI